MKRVIWILFPLFVLLIASNAFAKEPQVGKMFTFRGEGENRGGTHYLINADGEPFFDLNKMKPSAEFIKCIDNGKYVGNLEITSKVLKYYSEDGVYELKIDTSATCKRIK